ncbi:hypothetical protein ABEB36_009886 [Hypothenemus hampei]|uniref:Uncharacterized protein n=1 Tax=Hypothenemus hampei TaxID=57062 RepID=A0ABD1EHT5_HYPHA
MDASEVQRTPPQENGSKIEETVEHTQPETVTNGKDLVKTAPKLRGRSRSRTPQKKKERKSEAQKEDSLNGHEKKSSEEVVDESRSKTRKSPRKALKEPLEVEVKEVETVRHDDIEPLKNTIENIEMEALILASDEPDPELQFDESSDKDSGKGSPIQPRCKTRRSHTRNIPTPKTPKNDSESNSAAPTPTPETINDTNESLNVEDASTRAQIGSDSTRLDFVASNITLDENASTPDDSYLNYSRDLSVSEHLRNLSARKTIRPLNDSYRLRAFKNCQNRSDLNLLYSDDVDRVTGVKRKRSSSPEERKKFKSDYSLVSYLTSPLSNLKNKFLPDFRKRTPMLIGYKDSNNEIHGEAEVVSEEIEKKNRCTIM